MKLAGMCIVSLAVSLAGCGTDNRKEAQHELQRGASALREGNPQAAISRLDKSLAKEPSAEAYQLRAEATLDASRFRRALEDAESGLKLDPDNRNLRQVRDLAAACLKLVQGEASVVEHTRYRSPQTSAQRGRAPVEQLSFGDVTEQKKELRDLVERNPFWQKTTNSRREAYLQDLLEVDDEFMPLVVSCEGYQLLTDQTINRDYREQFELDLRVTCGLLRAWPLVMQTELAKQTTRGRVLLTSNQRAAIARDLADRGTDVRKLEWLANTIGIPLDAPINIRVQLHTWSNFDKHSNGCFRSNGTKRDFDLDDEPTTRRLSTDILLGKLRSGRSLYGWNPPGDIIIASPNVGITVNR